MEASFLTSSCWTQNVCKYAVHILLEQQFFQGSQGSEGERAKKRRTSWAEYNYQVLDPTIFILVTWLYTHTYFVHENCTLHWLFKMKLSYLCFVLFKALQYFFQPKFVTYDMVTAQILVHQWRLSPISPFSK